MLRLDKTNWRPVNDGKTYVTKVPSVTHPYIIDLVNELDNDGCKFHINELGKTLIASSYGVISDMLNGIVYFYVQSD